MPYASHSPPNTGVAPYAGAWIEIASPPPLVLVLIQSHPTRVRGLKSIPPAILPTVPIVAPYAGAWIEIDLVVPASSVGAEVAPYAGAWIEMPSGSRMKMSIWSHPTRVRGLKW